MVTDSVVYFGAPGSLVAITWPRGGLAATRIRDTSTFPLGSGGAQVWRMLGGKRIYRLDYSSLDYSTFITLLAYDQGHNGPGPFALVDPGQRNMLTVNQSAATSLTNGADNFTVSGSGGTITSDAVLYHRGPRSLKWSFSITNPSNGATLALDAPEASWSGIPVVLRAHTFSFYARAAAGSGPVSLQAKMAYLTSAGGANGSTTGNLTAATSAAWTQLTVTGTPGASSAFLNCSVVASAGTITSGEAVNLDEFMLNEGSAVDSTWSPGTGVMPVQIVSLADVQPFYSPDHRLAPVLVLQEVGA